MSYVLGECQQEKQRGTLAGEGARQSSAAADNRERCQLFQRYECDELGLQASASNCVQTYIYSLGARHEVDSSFYNFDFFQVGCVSLWPVAHGSWLILVDILQTRTVSSVHCIGDSVSRRDSRPRRTCMIRNACWSRYGLAPRPMALGHATSKDVHDLNLCVRQDQELVLPVF